MTNKELEKMLKDLQDRVDQLIKEVSEVSDESSGKVSVQVNQSLPKKFISGVIDLFDRLTGTDYIRKTGSYEALQELKKLED